MKKTPVFLSLLFLLTSASTYAETFLYYASSPTSFIGSGKSEFITGSKGFTFSAEAGADQNSVGVNINNFASISDFSLYRVFNLVFYAPYETELNTGFYLDAQRANSNTPPHPGLNFEANNRTANSLNGNFKILELNYNPDGSILNLAADFLENEEGNVHDWIGGSIRINSNIAVTLIPEPQTYALLIIGLGLVGIFSRKQIS